MNNSCITGTSNHFPFKTVAIALIFIFLSGITHAQQSPADQLESLIEQENKPSIEVLVLGVFHFTRAPAYNAIDKPEQQRELKALVHSLSAFEPTKIALEYVREEHERLDSLYQEYRAGNHKLTVNERQQIGFRLAGRLDHRKVYSIDYKKPWGMRPALKYANKHHPEFVNYLDNWRSKGSEIDSVMHHNFTISEILSFMATDTYLDRVQRVRMRTLEIGAGENYVGVEPVSSVYKRNMRIFANLMDIAEPGDRILIVYGAGHSYFFNKFIQQHPDTKLVDPGTYLDS